jgi:aspartyl-tRNA(Asn)/glutamyl-tRNA(Gln) amidotransferase subunit A
MGRYKSSDTKPLSLESEFSLYHEALDDERTTCEDSIREELKNIGRYNRELNAFVMVLDGERGFALSRARELDAAHRDARKRSNRDADGSGRKRRKQKKNRSNGRRRRKKNEEEEEDTVTVAGGGLAGLYGIPLAIKDNFSLGGFPTTDATYYFREYVSDSNAELVDDALGLGCIPVGKTNMHELALGGTSAASYFGPVRNPHDPERVSGGSSGGSAVAVARSVVPVLGFGSDTGGSVRIPAALCGVMGFKPTLGALSLEGVFPLSATLDHAGLLTRTMPDMVRAWEHLTGRDNRGGGGRKPEPKRTREGRKLVVGVPTRPFLDEVEETVLRNFWAAMDRMRASDTFSIVEVETGSRYERFSTARGEIQLREAAWFFGDLVKSEVISSHMNADVLTLLGRGMRIGNVRYFNANLVRLECIRTFGALLKKVDAVAMPTTRITAPKVAEVTGNEAGRLRRQLLQNTEAFNLCGFPALSIPSNPGASGLPTAVQFACALGDDDLTLHIGEIAMREIAG